MKVYASDIMRRIEPDCESLHLYGVRARIVLPVKTEFGLVEVPIETPGVWDIEIEGTTLVEAEEESIIEEYFQEEKAALIAMLNAMGITVAWKHCVNCNKELEDSKVHLCPDCMKKLTGWGDLTKLERERAVDAVVGQLRELMLQPTAELEVSIHTPIDDDLRTRHDVMRYTGEKIMEVKVKGRKT